MSADEAYQYKLRGKLDNNHNPEIISFYIKHIVLIAYIIH